MIDGHGDDSYKYSRPITANFSSNVYNKVNLSRLKVHLCECIGEIGNYPEPEPYTLEARMASRCQLPSGAVCVTNGATEAIYLIAQTFRGTNTAILQPTFSEYADACRLHGHKVVPIYNLNRLPDRGRLIWLCNPNNPTGEVREKEVLTACIKQNPQRIFIMDQSYEFFTQKALLTAKEAAEFPNVILLHSMTKRFEQQGKTVSVTMIREGFVEQNEIPEELPLLPKESRYWLREILLCADGEPWLAGRTVVPVSTLSGPELALQKLGKTPLGRYLFTSSTLTRDFIEIGRDAGLWGRRSRLRLSGKPLLLTELFLPASPLY